MHIANIIIDYFIILRSLVESTVDYKSMYPCTIWVHVQLAAYVFFAWARLAKAKGHSCHTKKINPCQNIYEKKKSKSSKHACLYATKERPDNITMCLGLDIIIKLKFTTIFDRCAILNVLNYLTKNLSLDELIHN